jgi:RecB family endonuclease NucS
VISQEFCDRLNRDLGEKKLIILVCCCSIDYHGRSRSKIGRGHRIITIKPDSTILIHSLSGFKPLNWMSSPTETVAEYGDGLSLYSQRTKAPFEEIEARVHEVVEYHAYPNLRDEEVLAVTHTEKDLRDYLVKNPHLVDPDFVLRKTEYETPLGFFDLYGRIGEEYVVVELKAEKAGLPAALQIKRYVEWLRTHVSPAKGILMAPGITPNALRILNKERIIFKKIDVRKLELKDKKERKLGDWC